MTWPKQVGESQSKIDWFSGSGAGGQNRNKNQSCCRMIHEPTGLQATSQDLKSREQNKKAASKTTA